jgi:rod shape determining protein RodA
MLSAKLWRHFDFWLLGAVVLLCLIGIAMIRSTTLSTPDTGIREFSRQVLFAVIGIPIVLAVSTVDYRLWGSMSVTLYVILLVLLAFVVLLGDAVFGARRWIPLERFGIPLNLQPSELGKFIMVLTLGYYLATNAERVGQFRFVLKTLVFIGVPVAFIILQPDFSSVILYGVIWFGLLWTSGLRLQHILILAGVAVFIGLLGFAAALQSDEARYIALRIVNFVWPDPNSQQYRDAIYNINQALISIGSGGWFGQGYGLGSQVQLRFLKVRHTDYIFASIAHEFGFVGAVIVIAVFAFLLYRIFRAGQIARDPYGRLICFGVGTVIMFEAFSNIATNLNLMPVTGSPLPFLSYGGSSLWTFLMGIGLVESVILRQKQIEF